MTGQLGGVPALRLQSSRQELVEAASFLAVEGGRDGFADEVVNQGPASVPEADKAGPGQGVEIGEDVLLLGCSRLRQEPSRRLPADQGEEGERLLPVGGLPVEPGSGHPPLPGSGDLLGEFGHSLRPGPPAALRVEGDGAPPRQFPDDLGEREGRAVGRFGEGQGQVIIDNEPGDDLYRQCPERHLGDRHLSASKLPEEGAGRTLGVYLFRSVSEHEPRLGNPSLHQA